MEGDALKAALGLCLCSPVSFAALFSIQPRSSFSINSTPTSLIFYFSSHIPLLTRTYCFYHGRLLRSRIDRLLTRRSPLPGRLRSRSCPQGKLCRKSSFPDQERVSLYHSLSVTSTRPPPYRLATNFSYTLKLIAIIMVFPLMPHIGRCSWR